MKILIIGGLGYIGSRLCTYLLNETESNYDIQICDSNLWGRPEESRLSTDLVRGTNFEGYDVLVYLAGHSSVAMCANHETDALINNVMNFRYVLNNISKDQKFIFASTASIYHSLGKGLGSEGIYDLSMYSRELLALAKSRTHLQNIVGIRFATVNGYSPNFRPDLMINKMFLDACQKGKITLTAPGTKRPILHIDDLCKGIHYLLQNNEQSSIVSFASTDGTVKDYGRFVSNKLRTDLEIIPNTHSYYDFDFKDTPNYLLDNQIIESIDLNETLTKIVDNLSEHKTQILSGNWQARV